VSAGLQPLAAGFAAPVTGWFTNRSGGVSTGPWESLNLGRYVDDDPRHVEANRERLTELVGSRSPRFARQVHGAGVAVVDSTTVGRAEWAAAGASDADALVTAMPGIPLVVLAADCVPVLLADPVAGVVAAAHAGRPGLAAGVLQRTIEAMVGLGADAGRLSVVIGPAVCGRCYEVPAALRAEVAATVPNSATTTRQGTPALDLPAGAESIVRAAGVSSVPQVEICTIEDESFFSHRRSGGRPTGRQAGVVMLDA
jgi:YfiH family protein